MIFCVEDDDNIRELVIYTLETTGLEARGFADGTAFMEALAFDTPELVLLDIMLPYRNGDTVLTAVRECSTVPIIVISAKGTTQNKVDLLRLGADDYITKPFDMEEVLARIESNLRRVQFQKDNPTHLRHGDLVLDLNDNTAFLQGSELTLTAKEFAILELLMKYPDKIFSKANLFQSVWNAEYISEDNTLNVHISNLRSKLKAVCPDKDFIDTVWGIGYRLHKARD